MLIIKAVVSAFVVQLKKHEKLGKNMTKVTLRNMLTV